jgi:hypothetical protein
MLMARFTDVALDDGARELHATPGRVAPVDGGAYALARRIIMKMMTIAKINTRVPRRQLLPAGVGSKLVGLGGTPVGLDLGNICQVSMLACLASQHVAMLRLAPAQDVGHRDRDDQHSNDRGNDGEQHWRPP